MASSPPPARPRTDDASRRAERDDTMHHTTPNPLGPTPRSKPTSKAASPLPLTALTDSGAYNNDGIGHSLVGAAWSIPTGLSASEEAIARKETLLLRRETHTLAKRANHVDDVLSQMKQDKKGTTRALEAKAREANFLRREVERVVAERDAMVASVSADRAYIRRLEHKMTAGGPDNAERCAMLRARVKELKDAVAAVKASEAEKAAEIESLRGDKASLAHALELRAAQLSAEGGGDVPSRLLYAVAKGREEAVSLAVQLAEKHDALTREKEECERLRVRCEECERAKEDAMMEAARVHANVSDLDKRTAALKTTAEAEVTDAHEALAKASELALQFERETVTLRAALDKEKLHSRSLELALGETETGVSEELEGMKKEMDAAVAATEAEAAKATREAAAERDEWRLKAARLEAELEAARKIAAAAEEASKTHDGVAARRAEIAEAEAARRAEQAEALEEEAGNLTAQIEAFAVVNARLQDAAASAQSRFDAEVAKCANLRAQVQTLEAQMAATRAEKTTGEGDLKRKLRGALEELATVIAQRDEQRLALKETMSRCASAMARADRADANESSLKSLVDNLTRSKTLLQETMVEQLASVRTQLENAQAQNAELEAAVTRQRIAAEKLQGLVADRGSFTPVASPMSPSPR